MKFKEDQNAESLSLKGDEVFDIEGLSDTMAPKSVLKVMATKADGSVIEFQTTALLNLGRVYSLILGWKQRAKKTKIPLR